MDQIGKYRIVRVVGEGGMGRVYEATDPVINRRVAIKTVSQNVLQDPDTRARFLREAQAAGQLSHPNLITIFDVGEEGGSPFIVMEYLEGEELTRVIARHQLTLDTKLRLVTEVCQGLAYAHSKGLIHRDIKPANIFITTGNQVKILDFGLARGAVSELTQTGRVVGTPSYMAPEQVRGDQVDHRSDIFAVGVVLYELLSGQKAFKGDSVAATIFQVLERQPDPLEQLDPNLPPGVSRVVERAIAKDPGARYQQIEEMLADVNAIRIQAQPTTFLPRPATPYPGGSPTAASVSAASSPVSVASRPGSVSAPSAAESTAGAAASTRSADWRPWALAGAIAATAIGGFFVVNRPSLQTVPATAATAPAEPPRAAAPPPTTPLSPASPPQETTAPPEPHERRPPQSADEPRSERRDGRNNRQVDSQRERASAPSPAPSRPAAPVQVQPTAPAQPPRITEPVPAPPPAPPARETPPPAPDRTPSPAPLPDARIPAVVLPTVPPAPPAPAVDPTAALADTMGRYKNALESRDIGALKQIWPSLAGRQESAIRNEFDNARSIAVDLQNVSPVVANNTATVTCRRDYSVTTMDGRTLKTATRMTVTLTRRNGLWVIENIRHEAER